MQMIQAQSYDNRSYLHMARPLQDYIINSDNSGLQLRQTGGREQELPTAQVIPTPTANVLKLTRSQSSGKMGQSSHQTGYSQAQMVSDPSPVYTPLKKHSQQSLPPKNSYSSKYLNKKQQSNYYNNIRTPGPPSLKTAAGAE